MGDIVFGNKSGDTIHGDKNVHAARQPPGTSSGRRGTILVLSANADGRQQLQLDRERRAIDHQLAHSRLEVRTADAVRLDDLQQALMRHQPVIAHFSGHGHPRHGLQVVDELGLSRSVPPRALSELFAILGKGLRCVVLNACHTEAQAAAIAAHVPFVVGMRRQVLDDTAIMFATGFYRALAHGRTIAESFLLARNGLDLHGVPDSEVPRLIARPGAPDRPLTGAP